MQPRRKPLLLPLLCHALLWDCGLVPAPLKILLFMFPWLLDLVSFVLVRVVACAMSILPLGVGLPASSLSFCIFAIGLSKFGQAKCS